MKLRTAVLVGVFAMAHTSAWAQGRVQVCDWIFRRSVSGVFRLSADGQIGGSATETADRIGERDGWDDLDLAPCASAGHRVREKAISAAATDVWKVTGTVLELNRRAGDGPDRLAAPPSDGQDEASAPQSTTLTLKRGERTTLETISRPARGSCAAYTDRSTRCVTLETMPAIPPAAAAVVAVGRPPAARSDEADGGFGLAGGGVAVSAGS